MKHLEAIVALACLTLPAAAQDTTTSSPARPPFVVGAGEVELTAFVDQCAHYLGANVVLDKREVEAASGMQGSTIRLQQAISTDQKGCEELLAAMLSRSGFALTWLNRPQKVYEAVLLNGPRAREMSTRATESSVDNVLQRPHLKMPVSVTLPLEHVNAIVAVNALRPVFASTGGPGNSLTLGSAGNSGGILLIGMQDQVASAIRLVRDLDAPAPEAKDPSLADRVAKLEARLAAIEKALEALPRPAGRSSDK
jgi:hypothetical protein